MEFYHFPSCIGVVQYHPRSIAHAPCASRRVSNALRIHKALSTAEQLAERFSHERLREMKSDLDAAAGGFKLQRNMFGWLMMLANMMAPQGHRFVSGRNCLRSK